MFYIHQAACISPQRTFSNTPTDLLPASNADIDLLQEYESVDNKMKVQEPPYPGIPVNILRRMAKSVRMGVGTALPLIRGTGGPMPEGIIIGTANGGMEESVKFLKQIVEYKEEMLTPGNFVQSIPNAISSQISLLSQNKGYNITHVHRGLAFENAVIDAAMNLKEHPGSHYLVGGVDEMATYHYNLEYLEGSYKKEPVSNRCLYETDSPGSLAGEGAAMFLVNKEKAGALAKVQGLSTLHSKEEGAVRGQLQDFLDKQAAATGELPDLFLTGENGDNRFHHFYAGCEDALDKVFLNKDVSLNTIPGSAGPGHAITIARYKHMSGEYPTATAFALWVACRLLGGQPLPGHMIKRSSGERGPLPGSAGSPGSPSSPGGGGGFRNVLIYNNYKGIQHSFMWVSAVS